MNIIMSQEEVWDKIAESWAENRAWVYPDISIFLRDKKGKILEVGCGTCKNLASANKKGNELYGTDFSADILSEAEKYCKEHKMKVELKKANAEYLQRIAAAG